MKFSTIGLVFSAVASVGSAKQYYNRQIHKDKTGVLGPRAHYIYESPEDTVEDERRGPGLKGHSHGRRAEGENPDPPEMSSDEGDDDDGLDPETLFYEARDLDFFQEWD